MSVESHHAKALLETVQLELDRAHRAAIVANAGEIRRSLDLALAALREAGLTGLGADVDRTIETARDNLSAARADLDNGALMQMEQLIEAARSSLARL